MADTKINLDMRAYFSKFCLVCLLVTAISTCSNLNMKDDVPSYISFDHDCTQSVFVLHEREYQTSHADSTSVVSFGVERSNLAEGNSCRVMVVATDDVISGTVALPSEAYEIPSEVLIPEGKLSGSLDLSLDLKWLSSLENRDGRYSLVLKLTGASDNVIDKDKNKVRILIDAGQFLKKQGLYYKWNLDFYDDFDGTGPMLGYRQDYWGLTNSAGHGNIGYRRDETVTREDGILVCGTYRSPAYNDEIPSSHLYHRKEYLYARFEFKVKIDLCPYQCVGGVVLTWPNHSTGAWPRDGELDIYETFGTAPVPLTFIHYGTDNGKGGFADNSVSMRHPVPREEWTVMVMEWTPEELRLYRNGELVWTLDDTKYIPKVPHYFVIQSGANNESLPSGARVNMYVDYVKIYTPAE